MNTNLEHILLSDTISDEDLTRLSENCANDTAAEKSVRAMVSIFAELEKRVDSERLVSAECDFLEAWNLTFPEPATLRLVRIRPAMRWVAAAAIIVSIGLFSYVTVQPVEQSVETVAADADQFLIHDLADGSTVRISPGSTIGVAQDGTVTLAGSAFFSISPQTSSLKVVTAHTTTEVVGTQFGIFESSDATQIIMMEGVVTFSSNELPDEPVRLELNQTSTVVGSAAPSPPTQVDILSALAWTDLIVFRSSTLAYVARTLSAQLGVEIHIEDSIRELTFTNTFRPEQGIEEMLNTVALALNVDVLHEANSSAFSLRPKL